jgi:lysozyme family protein
MLLELRSTPSADTRHPRFQECLETVLRGEANPSATTEPASFDGNSCAKPRSGVTLSVYLEECWIPSHASRCPSPLDLVVFDCAVRSGAMRAILTLQQALGLPECDGVFGHRTREALEFCDGYSVAIGFLELRRAFYQDAAFRTFCKGKAHAQRLEHIDWLLDAIGAIA